MTLKKTMTIGLGLILMGQAHANKPYTYPAHEDISVNNYDGVHFKAGKAPFRFTSKDQVEIGSEIMVNDRYQRIYKKVGGEYKYITMLARIDRVKVLDRNDQDDNEFIKVKVLSSVDTRQVGQEVYTRPNGLSEYEDYKDFDADVYMVQNIATEKLRVYQRLCKDNTCPPKLIFETDFVSGMKKGDPTFKFNTNVGNYRIFEWEKFYQDRGWGGHYPSWFDPNFPSAPGPDESWAKWFKSDVMPWESCHTGKDGKEHCSYKGMMRGAFGWYTALVEPHYGTGQWTHGTIGWAESSQENILRAKGEDFLGALANFFTSLRSSGCSRVSNPSIAFLRYMLPVGTPLIKIYALEEYQDQASMEKNYNVGQKNQWEFILTKNGVRQVGEKATPAHKNYVERHNLDDYDNILEQGTYKFKVYPSIVQYQYKPKKDGDGYKRTKGCIEDNVDNYSKDGKEADDRSTINVKDVKKIRSRQCNVYRIPVDAFVGKFYVDTGLVDGYDHPKAEGVIRGGFRSQKFPKFLNVHNYK